MEIGSPMASLYLLQNPNHHVSHNFIPFWWKSFVNDVRNPFSPNKYSEHKGENNNQQNFETNQVNSILLNDDKMDVDNLLKNEKHQNINEIFKTDQINSIIMDHDKMDIDEFKINTKIDISTDKMDIDYPNSVCGGANLTYEKLFEYEQNQDGEIDSSDD